MIKMELNLTFMLNMITESLLARKSVMLMQKKDLPKSIGNAVKIHLEKFNVFNEKILRIQIDMRDI